MAFKLSQKRRLTLIALNSTRHTYINQWTVAALLATKYQRFHLNE